jgi:hypothetical protein
MFISPMRFILGSGILQDLVHYYPHFYQLNKFEGPFNSRHPRRNRRPFLRQLSRLLPLKIVVQTRHVLSGTMIGMSMSMTLPFLTFRSISSTDNEQRQQHQILFISVHGALFGGLIGFMHRGLDRSSF